jgi:transcription elongation factor GreA
LSHLADLNARLTELRAERGRLEADLPAPTGGDEADRATNMDAYAQLGSLDDRIAAVESTIAAAARPGTGRVSVGSVVDLDFGDGTETFVVSAADPQRAVITPGSPLGKALIGATVGARISYQVRPGQKINLTVTRVD